WSTWSRPRRSPSCRCRGSAPRWGRSRSRSTRGSRLASETQRAIESIVMVADAPVEPHLLAQLLEVSPSRVEELCAELEAAYRNEDRGFELVRGAGGYR